MANLPKGTGGDLHIKVDISIETQEYQAYLDAGKRIEEEREAFGIPTPEAYDALREAVENVAKLASKIYNRERGN